MRYALPVIVINKYKEAKMKRNLFITVAVVLIVAPLAFGGGRSESAEEKTQIEFFLQKPEIQNIMEEFIAQFEEENPNINVEINAVPDSKQVLLVRMANNDLPDVFSTWPNEVEFKVQADEGYMMDLTGIEALNRVEPSVVEALRHNGKDYAVPISVNTMGIYFNPAIFDELSLSRPSTYDELVDLLEAVQEDGRYIPMVFSDREPWAIGYEMVLMSGMQFPDPYRFFDDLAAGRTTAQDSVHLRRVAEKVLELREFSQDDNLGTGYGQAISDFATGKAATYVQGIWAIPSIREANPDFEFEMFPFPADNADQTRTIYGVDFAVAASADTPNRDAALKLIDFLSRQDIAQSFAERDGSPSVIEGVEASEEAITDLVELLNTGRSFEWLNFRWAPGVFDNHHRVAQTLVASGDVEKYLREVTELFTAR